jgi:hypothetical protein
MFHSNILFSLSNFMGTPNSMRTLYNTSLLTDVLSHCTPSFSPACDECNMLSGEGMCIPFMKRLGLFYLCV